MATLLYNLRLYNHLACCVKAKAYRWGTGAAARDRFVLFFTNPDPNEPEPRWVTRDTRQPARRLKWQTCSKAC